MGDALCVFKSGGVDSDLLEQNDKQILFYLDLEDEKIVSKEDVKSPAQEDSEEENDRNSMHPMLFNQYPLCKDHSLMLLFAQEGLPQVLSDELLLLVLQMFKLTDQPSLRIGYNSMGADCIINNLHMHVLTTSNLYGAAEQSLPIENADKKLFFKSNLQHKDKEEINMFNCGVRFGEVQNYFLRALLISPDILSDETSLEDA